MKPAKISEEHLKFIEMYVSGAKATSKKRNKYTFNNRGDMANDPTMDWNKPIIMYIPGWMDNMNLPMGSIMESLYKKRGYNAWRLNEVQFVIKEYPIAARAVVAIGERVGMMLANLTATQPKFNPKKLELLGLSLGAHTMGFIAKTYTKLTGLKISRLTGMDPSGPCFRNRDPKGRVDDSDADFVDLIMTNIDSLGMAAPVGHVNIYVNGGETQPGDLYWMACGPFCSHARSFTLWMAAMIYPESFIAIKCDSVQDAREKKCYNRRPLETNLLGPNVDKDKPGIYYLATKNTYPFFLGKAGLKKEHDYILKQLSLLNKKEELIL
ncbi:lipase member H-like isoform X2 [Plodia interpunctella]|nr:lipase member H-like isoform X2 [Plodia interpunctella]